METNEGRAPHPALGPLARPAARGFGGLAGAPPGAGGTEEGQPPKEGMVLAHTAAGAEPRSVRAGETPLHHSPRCRTRLLWTPRRSPADQVAQTTGSIFSSFWRLEVQVQGVGGVGVFGGPSPWFVDAHLPPGSLVAFPLFWGVLGGFASSQNISDWVRAPWPHFNLTPSLKTLPPNTVAF